MMRDIAWLIRKMLISTFRNKASWLVYIALPVISVLLSMLVYSNTNSGVFHVGIVNLDGDQEITQHAMDFVMNSTQDKVTIMDEETLEHELAAGKLDSGIIFDQGFAARLREGLPEGITIVSVKGAEVTAYVKALLESYLSNIAALGKAAGMDDAQFTQLYHTYIHQNFEIRPTTLEDTSNSKSLTYQSIGFLITLMMFSAVNMTDMILREKEARTFLRLFSSPISSRTYVLANVIVNLMIMLVQIMIAVFALKVLLRIDTGMSTGQFIASLLLFGLTAIGLSLMIIAFAKNRSGASALQNLIITPSCMLAGCFFPIDIMPEAVRKISKFMPQRWLLDMTHQLQQGQSFGSLYMNIFVLLAFASVFALIAILRFSRNNDVRQFI